MRSEPLPLDWLLLRESGGRSVTYHSGIYPEAVAEDVIVAGDAERVKWLRDELLVSVEHSDDHRGLPWFTGNSKRFNRPLTVACHQMGVGTGEITLVELIAATQLDFSTLTPLAHPKRLNVTRLGTCGSVMDGGAHPLGSPFVLSSAVGIEGINCFYEVPQVLADLDFEQNFRRRLFQTYNAANKPHLVPPVYSVKFDQELNSALGSAATNLGLSVGFGKGLSTPGFFGPQGRDLIVPRCVIPDLHLIYKKAGVDVIEMECAFHGLLSRGVNNRVATVLIPVANRITHESAASLGIDLTTSFSEAAVMILEAYEALHA